MHYFHQFQLPFKQRTNLSKVKGRALGNVVILQCARRFRYLYKNISSVHLLVNEQLFRQSRFELIKTFSSVQLLFKQLCSSMSGDIGRSNLPEVKWPVI